MEVGSRKKQTSLSSLALAALVIAGACSSGTEVMSRWIELGLKQFAMKKVLVIGIGFTDYYGRGMVVGTPGPEAKMVDVVRLETSCWLFHDNAGTMV